MAFSAIANVALDRILIAGAGLGVVGAAIATVAAQGAGAVFALWLARRRYASARSLLRSARDGRERGKAIAATRDVLRVGIPMAVQQAVINLSYVFVTAWLNSYGPTIAAASGVGLKISTVAGLPCWGIGQAVSAAVSQSIGAGMPERSVAFARSGCLMAIAVTVGIQVAVQLGAGWLVSLFGESSRELSEAAGPLPPRHLQRERGLLRGDVRPRLVRPGLGRAEAGPGELPHRRLRREGRAGLAPVRPPGLRLHRNLRGTSGGTGAAGPRRLHLPPAVGAKEPDHIAIAFCCKSLVQCSW